MGTRIEKRISLITLEVHNLERAINFYTQLGLERHKSFTEGVALAYNTRTENDVDLILALAQEAGGEIVKSAQKVFWGGYSGYFKDTEGHLWEVAYNSSFPIDTSGNISLP